jgi:formylglycine-generating enzyme required for sulfatase activity
VGVLFISHSSKDNAKAIVVRDWLAAQGWSDVFLDLDFVAGERWQQELKRAGETCTGVLVLISPDWLQSFWCRTEFLLADQLGKQIFPLFVAPTPFDDLPVELKAKFQIADISDPSKEAAGFQSLATGLRRAGLDPTSFDWPPPGELHRSVYRGLQALDVQDAAIFFGRDAAITKGLDDLRQMRRGAPERVLVILGASGAGKSSFLRAGLLARLARDRDNFTVLPVIRPGSAAISGLSGLESCLRQAGGDAPVDDARNLEQAFATLRLRPDGQVRPDGEQATPEDAPRTIVIPVDQAEELLASENTEAAAFCQRVSEALETDANALLIVTLRSDAFEAWQAEPSLARLPQRLFSLPQMAPNAFKDAIEGPASLAKPPVEIEPQLTQALLADLSSRDALPLLAFTLERLQTQFASAGKLTLADYTDRLGGLEGSIQTAVAAAIGPWPDAETLALTRRLFLPALVQVDSDGVKRRVASRRDIPADAQSLADRLVAQRLLTSDRRLVDGRDVETLEVAHEAILRQWPPLAQWIAEESESLRTLDGVRAAAREWRAHPHSEPGADAWLVHHDTRLQAALAVAARRDFAGAVDATMRDYLAACRAAERKAAGQRQRLQALAAVLAVSVLGAIGWGAWVFRADLTILAIGYSLYRPYVRSSTELEAAAPGQPFSDCKRSGDCPVMIVVPAGRFMMGAPTTDPLSRPNERPQHPVTVDRFAVSKFDITFADWAVCASRGGCSANPNPDRSGFQGGDDLPVVGVSWCDAQDYVAWLSQVTGAKYRLLTEAEWEYAARGVTTLTAPYHAFPWGDQVVGPNHRVNADCDGCGSPWDNRQPSPVTAFHNPNAFGLYGMAGDVWQWVEDCGGTSYDGAPSTGYPAPARCDWVQGRAMRGGSWHRDKNNPGPTVARSAFRGGDYLSAGYNTNGFRVARMLSGQLRPPSDPTGACRHRAPAAAGAGR